jgi:OmcA/MtrC family decaheme c-type cytochrome
VTIASAPVVSFTVVDSFGRAVIGLGNTSKSATAVVASYPNLSFSIAKLVPGASGSPSKWVSYVVTSVPSSATSSPTPSRPSTDNTGTLVDKGDGTYTYTFYRDITTVKSQLDGMTVSPPNNIADLGDVTYNPNLTHRVTIALSGSAPATGSNTPTGATSSVASVPIKHPANAIYDFIPATGAKVTASDFSREVVSVANCEACHRQLGGIPGLSEEEAAAGFHGGSRNETQYCVVCHTDQRRYGQKEATFTSNGAIRTFTSETRLVDGRTIGNLPNYIHKLHMGPFLVHQNYDYADALPAKTTYPQDIRNCTSCHDGSSTPSRTTKTKDGDNWKTKPSALACGACHDGVNFATGAGLTLRDKAAGLTQSNINGTGLAHPAGPLPDDSQCSLCHKSNGSFPVADIDLAHIPVTPPNPDNALAVAGGSSNTHAAWIASGSSVGRLPPGAITPTYEVQSVSRNASKQPVMVFRWLQNGTPVPINAFASAAVNPATGLKEMWDNFMGSPSAYFVFAVPQDGNTAPADFNATVSAYLRKVWDGSATGSGAANLTGPDAGGFYMVTLTGVTIPDNAVMLTGGMGYSYSNTSTLPLTQTNLPDFPVTDPVAGQTNKKGGLIVIAPNVQKVATGYTGRRAIVEDKRCNACHQELGTFSKDAFHAGQRNDATTCSWCHTPNRTSSGWSADSTSVRARDPRGGEASGPLQLARIIVDRGLLQDHVSGHPQRLPDLPPAGHVRFQCHAGRGARRPTAPDGGPRHLQCLGQPFALRRAGDELRQRVLLQRDQRGYHRGSTNHARDVANRGGVFRLPRLNQRHFAHEGQHRLVLCGTQRSARHQRDLPDLPRHRPDGGHCGHAFEEPLSQANPKGGARGKKTSASANQAARPGRQEEGQGCG